MIRLARSYLRIGGRFIENEIEKYLIEIAKEKIQKVYKAINECSFSKGIIPEFLEGKILQDADMLESIGIISIMRTFSSAGQMKKSFYHPEDPFCKSREPDGKEYALNLFYSRLLIVKDLMHTETVKEIAVRRKKVLYEFLESFKMELYDDIDL